MAVRIAALEQHGVSIEQANAWIFQNVNSPALIFNTAKTFGLTTSDLANIVALSMSNASSSLVESFFRSQGLDSSELDNVSSDIFLDSNVPLLSASPLHQAIDSVVAGEASNYILKQQYGYDDVLTLNDDYVVNLIDAIDLSKPNNPNNDLIIFSTSANQNTLTNFSDNEDLYISNAKLHWLPAITANSSVIDSVTNWAIANDGDLSSDVTDIFVIDDGDSTYIVGEKVVNTNYSSAIDEADYSVITLIDVDAEDLGYDDGFIAYSDHPILLNDPVLSGDSIHQVIESLVAGEISNNILKQQYGYDDVLTLNDDYVVNLEDAIDLSKPNNPNNDLIIFSTSANQNTLTNFSDNEDLYISNAKLHWLPAAAANSSVIDSVTNWAIANDGELSNDVTDIFVIDDGNSTHIVGEKTANTSYTSTTDALDYSVVTLVGVDALDLTYEDGFIAYF